MKQKATSKIPFSVEKCLCGLKIIISLLYRSYNCYQFHAKFVTICKMFQAGLSITFMAEGTGGKEWVDKMCNHHHRNKSLVLISCYLNYRL